ncbi:hypothetical protein MCOR27_010227 [Pyricularia oryzae]|uniref:Uncharacterized protein n=2 Tax=Pyricularia TaxID=48558 RepID=A0ABQ8N6H4_PYRGI|nr:uncharacterized protein MGG_08567 [Pyricularia oryzae 70-15]KAH9427614.1 hypothetical protein MCOR02_011850 [Pyricularia oryzae]KAI6292107.1 hypothetical protein MCOR33_010115 [Pyricularia grisea]EHA49769.1 hypothetical protein MGG_08567 [Pyricularia oryzae 70-15]KAI6255227.1 hypothetical protein MCOR19_008255 [Pyricularia oryzae]KAI6265545.1 hypothetical protein MCOR26_010670 [Pyricularia oryzae]
MPAKAEARLDFDSDEVTYSFGRQGYAHRILESGRVNPCTPSDGGGARQYRRDNGREFGLGAVDVVVAHGPPRGVLDRTSRQASLLRAH